MRIGIDVSRTVQQKTGVGWYASHLVKGLARVDKRNQYYLYPCFWYCVPDGFRRADCPQQRNFHLVDRWRSLRSARRRWEHAERDGASALGRVDVLHSTAYAAPPLQGVGLVVTIHDMSFFRYPEFHEKGNIAFCTRECHRAARRASKIIVPSGATKADVVRYLHVREERIHIIYEAAGENFTPLVDKVVLREVLARHGIDRNYILFVGTVEPRKNLRRLLEAYLHLVRSRRERAELLVVAGARGWKNTDVYAFVEDAGLRGRVRFLDYVSDSDLRAFYCGARLFAYPSMYEGFGLPVIEAMACGCPVLTSRASSLPEVAGDGAVLVDPADVRDIVRALECILSDVELRRKLRASALARARCFSWDKAARETIGVYTQAASAEWARLWGGT